MKLLIKLLLAWGILDSALLAARPQQWSQFWLRGVSLIGSDRRIAGAVSGLQFALCIYVWRKLK